MLRTHLNALAISEIGLPGIEAQDGNRPLLIALSYWRVPADNVLDQLLDRGIRKLVARYRADRTAGGETTDRKQNKEAECEALKAHIAGLGERIEVGRLAEVLKGLHGNIVIRARVEEDGWLSGLRISV